MTATGDRRNDPDTEGAAVPWDERAIVGSWPGIPWWAAVLIGFGLAGLGAIIDMLTQGELGLLFQGCYFAGAVGAMCAVRRRSVFAPMVQPPLILAVTVPSVVLSASGIPEGSDMLAIALAIGTPLINGFPTMAITTAVTLLVGLVRIYRERDPNRPVKPARAKQQGASGGKASQSKPNQRPARERGEPDSRKRPAEGPSRGARPREAASRKPPPERGPQQGGKQGRGRQQERPSRAGREQPAGGEQARGSAGRRQPRKQPPEGGERGNNPRDGAAPQKRPRRSSGQQDSSGRQQAPKQPKQQPPNQQPPQRSRSSQPGQRQQPPQRPQRQQRQRGDQDGPGQPPPRQPRKRPWDEQR